MVRKKFEMCKNWKEKGTCRYGEKCLFAHGKHELTLRNPPDSISQTNPSVSGLSNPATAKTEVPSKPEDLTTETESSAKQQQINETKLIETIPLKV